VSTTVRVAGIVRGREIDAEAVVTLDLDAVVLSWANAAAWRLDLDGIEGVAVGATSLTVYLRDHDVLELTGNESLRQLANAVTESACRVPELTRGLKSFAAVPRGGGRHTLVTTDGTPSMLQSVHDLWFAPLLAARKAVHGVTDPERQVALMDGAVLIDTMTEVAARIAATLAPESTAEQRAIEAAIEDEAASMFAALQQMRLAGEAVRTGDSDTRFADWRRWVAAAFAVFAGADEAWGAIAEIVVDA